MSISPIQPDAYQELLADKVSRYGESFAELGLPAPTVFPSPREHFRMRAEFRIWHDQDELYYAMFDPAEPKVPVRIDHFPTASESICKLMPILRQALQDNEHLRQRLFQIEFLSTLSQDMLVTLIYHRKLDEDWQAAAETLATQLNIVIIGRSRKQKLVLERDFVEETLAIAGRDYRYRQYEGGFTQPNARVNCTMIEWALKQLGDSTQRDLVELYCGNGNFTAPLAGAFRRVLATEISKTSVKAAKENFALNHVDNVQILRMSSEEFTSALNGEREFRRLQGIELSDYELDTIFVDPPRAGLDDATRALVARFKRILYISCNPTTLHRDLQLLDKTHHCEQLAMFDQFPYTEHLECGVLLTERE